MAGGIPCQPFSLSGKRRGTQDDRHLWPYAYSLVKRYRPPWVLIENVTGFVSLALDLVCTDLESAGYTTQALVLPACAIGAPHERQRVFIVAYTTSGRPQVSAQALRHTCTDQSDAPDLLAHADSNQCGIQRQWIRADAEAISDVVAHADSNRQRVRPGQSQYECECSSAANTGAHGPQGNMAHAYVSRLQVGYGCPGQARAPATTNGRGARQSESRLGGVLDGASTWLDQMRWPAPPGERQYPWEPSRTITPKRDKERALRLRALGNAIVPQQIYPILYCILHIMKGQSI